jgi:hypothetical protein
MDVLSFMPPLPTLLKSKTHRASISGGAGFGSLQDFLSLSSLVPSTPEKVRNSYLADFDTNSV